MKIDIEIINMLDEFAQDNGVSYNEESPITEIDDIYRNMDNDNLANLLLKSNHKYSRILLENPDNLFQIIKNSNF